MKKVLATFLLFALAGCSQNINSVHWPENKQEALSSGITIPSVLTAQQEKNLAVLCRVWGFLKYFHPKVATGVFDADKALFAIMPDVLQASNTDSLDLVLYKWIEELGEVVSNPSQTNTNNAIVEPGMQWLRKDSIIGGKLRPQLLHIFNNRSSGEKYYGRLFYGINNPDFSKEFKYAKVRGEDGGMRMLSLFRYWNAIEYFFPSKYLTADNWDMVLEKFIPLFVTAKTDSSYRMTVCRLAASIHDTHAMGTNGDSGTQSYLGKYTLPVAMADIEGHMTVLFHRSAAFQMKSSLKPGDRILAINGVAIEKMIDSARPYVSASNPAAFKFYAMWKICRSYYIENKLMIERGGRKTEETVSYVAISSLDYDDRRYYTDVYPMYQKMADNIGYINLGKIQAKSLDGIFREFEHTSGLVIDIRNYPSQFMPFALGKYLKPTPSPFALFSSSDPQLPGRFILKQPISNGENNPGYYKGKIVILVNEFSISQSEYTAMALRTAPNAIVMGSQTGGADGDVSMVYLPGGMVSLISGLGVYYPDKRATQGIGIVPDIEVRPTLKGITEGTDEVLERAIQYIRNK
ncbi:MAG: S41 family peptidase [Bacteroidota bacterium]